MKALKEDLKTWNKNVYGDVGLKENRAMGDILRMDEKEFQGALSLEERHQRGAEN
jgi:hypothetical protein